jgi:hypothetical protein
MTTSRFRKSNGRILLLLLQGLTSASRFIRLEDIHLLFTFIPFPCMECRHAIDLKHTGSS